MNAITSAVRVEKIGNATLYLGDCRDILPTLEGVDAVVTDPPYGIGLSRGRATNRGKGISRGADHIIGDDAPFDPAPLYRWPCLLWGANHFLECLPKGNGRVRSPGSSGRWLVWDKLEHGGSGQFSEAEIGWCSSPGPTKIFRHMWLGVQRASQVGDMRQHPTEKPIALMEWCLGFVPKAEIVLDPYMGSGSTGCAAIRAGRKFIGVELDPHHYRTACRRIEQAQRQADMFVAPAREDPPFMRTADLFTPED